MSKEKFLTIRVKRLVSPLLKQGALRRVVVSIIILALFICSFCCSVLAKAKAISISASVNKKEITFDDQVTLIITVSGETHSIPRPKIPALEGFSSYSSGQSQSISIINGKVSASSKFTYILVPDSEGEHTIGSAEVTIKGQTYKTDPITIKVLPPGKAAPDPPTSAFKEEEYKPSEAGRKVKDIFITTSVDNEKPYVNEQIVLSFKFYRRINLWGNPEYEPASTTGFWVEDLPPQQRYYENVSGVQYLVTEIKTALFPTSSGKLTIGPATLKANVQVPSKTKRRSRSAFGFDSVFDDFFTETEKRTYRTPPIEIEVLSLPEEGKPADFTGAVGEYRLSASIDKSSVKAGEAISLRIDIEGIGNVESISKVDIPKLEGFKSYDSESSVDISKENYEVKGKKKFEIVLIPQKAGQFTIPSVRFPYFSPKADSYEIASSSPMIIDVAPGEKKEEEIAVLSIPDSAKKKLKVVERDIRYLKSEMGVLRKRGSYIYKNKNFLGFQFVPLVLFLTSFFYVRKKDKLHKDEKYARLSRAYKNAKKGLKQAEKILSESKSKEFYEVCARTIANYIGDRLNIPSAGITISVVDAHLRPKGLGGELLEGIKRCFKDCDIARFAPTAMKKEDMRKTLDDMRKVIKDLEGWKL